MIAVPVTFVNRKPFRALLLCCLSVLLFCSSPSAFAGAPSWVADELLVAPRAGVGRFRAEAIYRSHGATIVDGIPQIGVHVLRVPAAALDAVQQALARRPEFEFVERNRVMAPALSPNDPLYYQQWHLRRISGPSAWDVTVGDPGVVIAILDSGIDSSHPDLAPNLVPGYNSYDNNADTLDVYGHGTKVAGTAAAASDNAVGIASVAWRSRLMPIRVTDPYGYGYTSTIAKGLTWAADHGARVMNISFEDVAGSSTIRNAAQYVDSKGGVVVAAAGNCGCTDPTPENPYIVSVSATMQNDTLASWSSKGSYVDVAAPGSSIITTLPGGGYGSVGGTSYSSPIVAGVFALMMAANRGLGSAELVSILESTATDLGDPGCDASFGFGLINAMAAVNAAVGSAVPPPDTTAPSASISSPAEGSAVSGITTVGVLALDDRGVSRVELYIDGALLAIDTITPFSFAWDTSEASAGIHNLKAMAYDAAGNAGTSPIVQVSVAGGDSTPPQVQITSPANGTTATKNTKITLNASDDSVVSRLEAFVDGMSLGSVACSTATCSGSFTWRAQRASSGPHVVSGVAYDSAGNAGQATPLTINVK